MFVMDQSKTQGDAVLLPADLPDDVIVSPDTQRSNRVPPGQSRTKKWPVLDASGAPKINLAAWRFGLQGLVANPIQWTWDEFTKLPRVKVFADFHCVTRWSRLVNIAISHDGEAIAEEHGGPARGIVSQLYAWKSAEWAAGTSSLNHAQGDPWKEQRYGW